MKKVFVLVFVLLALVPLNALGQEQSADKIIVYYFHGNFRCAACTTIEKQTNEAIFQNFKAELDEGKLEIKTVNFDTKQNKHFKKDYGLFTKSVVLSLVQGGQETSFSNLQEVWQFVWNKDQFAEYIKSETQKYLDMLTEEEKQQ